MDNVVVHNNTIRTVSMTMTTENTQKIMKGNQVDFVTCASCFYKVFVMCIVWAFPFSRTLKSEPLLFNRVLFITLPINWLMCYVFFISVTITLLHEQKNWKNTIRSIFLRPKLQFCYYFYIISLIEWTYVNLCGWNS